MRYNAAVMVMTKPEVASPATEQDWSGLAINGQAQELLKDAYLALDASYGPRDLRRLLGIHASPDGLTGIAKLYRTVIPQTALTYVAAEAILRDLARDTDSMFADDKDLSEVVPFLEALDKVQQAGAVLPQEILTRAKGITEGATLEDARNGQEDRFGHLAEDGRYYRYIFPIDPKGKIHLVKVVSHEPLAFWQTKELTESEAISTAVASYNTSWGSNRLVRIEIQSLAVKRDRTKIGWNAIDFDNSDIALVTKGPAYPNAPETMDAFMDIPGIGPKIAARRRQQYEGESILQLPATV